MLAGDDSSDHQPGILSCSLDLDIPWYHKITLNNDAPENVVSLSHLKVTTACRVVLLPSNQPLARIPGDPQLISKMFVFLRAIICTLKMQKLCILWCISEKTTKLHLDTRVCHQTSLLTLHTASLCLLYKKIENSVLIFFNFFTNYFVSIVTLISRHRLVICGVVNHSSMSRIVRLRTFECWNIFGRNYFTN